MSTTGTSEESGVELGRAEKGRTPSAPLHVSPSKFLAVEASAVLSSLQTIPEFAETIDLIDSVRSCYSSYKQLFILQLLLQVPVNFMIPLMI